MYKVAICSSDIHDCSNIEEKILCYSKKKKLSIEVEIFYSSERFIEYMENNAIYDIVFIDTELKVINGIKLGKVIREKYWVDMIAIIYISTKITTALQLFEIMPSDFILKPISEKDICKALDFIIFTTYKRKLRVFNFKIAGIIYKVSLEEILYFESNNKIINIYTKYEKKSFYSTLDKVEKQLVNQNFFRIHKSYFVNWKYVSQCSCNKIVLNNNIELPISQTYRKDIKSIANLL